MTVTDSLTGCPNAKGMYGSTVSRSPGGSRRVPGCHRYSHVVTLKAPLISGLVLVGAPPGDLELSVSTNAPLHHLSQATPGDARGRQGQHGELLDDKQRSR